MWMAQPPSYLPWGYETSVSVRVSGTASPLERSQLYLLQSKTALQMARTVSDPQEQEVIASIAQAWVDLATSVTSATIQEAGLIANEA